MNILYIILKQVLWRFQIYNLFREKFKFRGFTKAFTNFAKYIIAFIFAEFKYLIINTKPEVHSTDRTKWGLSIFSTDRVTS